MEDWSCLGLKLTPPEDCDDDLVQPIDAVVLIKGFDERGNVSWWLARTPDLTDMDMVGPLRWALKKAEDAL